MNRKQLILLVIVGLVLAGLALFSARSRRAEYETPETGVGAKLLGDFPASEVGQVTVRSRDGEVNLVKNEVWMVKERSNYPASFTEIAELLTKFWELKPVQSQKVGQSQWGRLELLPPGTADAGTNTATLIELKRKDGQPMHSLLLGKKVMRDTDGQFGGYPVGRWIALPDNKETVFVVNEAFSDVEPKVDAWLNKDFFKVEKLGSISLVSTNATNSWTLSRTNESADWVLVDPKEGEQLDKTKTSSFNWAFSSPSFNDVFPKDSETVKDAFTNPTLIKLATLEGFNYEVKVGSQPDNDSFYVTVDTTADLPTERPVPADEKPEDKEKNEKAWKEQQDKQREKLKKEKALGNWVYKVSKWTVDSVLKDRGALLAEKKTETSTTSAPGTTADPDPLAIPPLPGASATTTPPLPPPPLPEAKEE
jgi:hypothetical protein